MIIRRLFLVRKKPIIPVTSRFLSSLTKDAAGKAPTKIFESEHTTTPPDPTTLVNQPPITYALDIADPSQTKIWPMFAVLSIDGKTALNPSYVPNKELVCSFYRMMGRIQGLDDIFFQAQRQGRISFYMQNIGEEALQIGSAAALHSQDVIFGQYREVGVLLWRGFTLQEAADQCFSNCDDLGKGRQMPVHYGAKRINFHTISSPLGTQIPQAVGAAYALKLDRERENTAGAVAVVYFGEGAASEGDFHAGMNMAATLETPILFFCRNNGYAISTPTHDQFRGDGIISRAAGYGMHAIRVDGNDALAVYAAVKAARVLALEKNCPVLIEAMSYRRGHHSTSDDSTRYRSVTEIKAWGEHFDAMKRLRTYMESQNWWSEEQENELRDGERLAVLQALETAERKPSPSLEHMFEDIYKVKPPHLIQQEKELLQHIKSNPEYYQPTNH